VSWAQEDTAEALKAAYQQVQELGMPLIGLPPYSPELNPVERGFEEVRRWIEGKVYRSIDEKVEAVQAFLSELESDPERVREITAWDWIDKAIQGLPVRLAA